MGSGPVSFLLLALLAVCAAPARADDPYVSSWFTAYSGQYARIYTNNAMKTAGTTLTTWSNGSQTQSLPSYCGVQEIYSSSNWVYLRTTGLAPHNMGPWNNGSFPNLPVNTKTLWRIPRTNSVPGTNALTGLGAIGYFVDGVAMFDTRDAFYWNGSSEPNGSGYWNRDAYVNESATFDAGYAHQENTGTHHYHANPPALRYQLGDHMDFNAATKTYSESTNAPTKHSPLLGWMADGCPLYGPYGYANATNPAGGIRRMVSGYVLRNGQYGTSNLTANGRTTIPQWAVRFYSNVASNILAGPTVNGTYPLGRYMEDNDYLGDHGFTQGTDFDLDEYNGRFCATPEFPEGKYCYFVSISSNGTPAFPYNIGRAFRGNPAGGSVTSIAETVVTNFLGNLNVPSVLNPPAVGDGSVTLAWSAVEGGTYQVETSSDLAAWNVLSTNVSPAQITGSYTNATAQPTAFYRVARTTVASFDPVSTGGGGGGVTITMSPASGNRSQAYSVTATISASATPSVPPTMATVQSFTVGGIAVTGATHATQYTVTGTLTIPAGATLGAQTVSITFSPPPGQPAGPTYTQANGFTIN